MKHKWLYLMAFSLPLSTFISIYLAGFWSYGTILYAFIFVPVLELLSKPWQGGIAEEKVPNARSDRFYDLLLYSMIPVQYGLLIYFLHHFSSGTLQPFEKVGMVLSMGIQCGAIGINVAHELGHRSSVFEQRLAKALLLSSLYLHFIVEHNRGHHTYVATPKDPATARLNEPIYFFWFRTIIGSFVSAWRIECTQLASNGKSVWTINNTMIRFVMIELVLLLLIFLIFGTSGFIGFVSAAFVGIILLETVNYIEHYGLLRKEIAPGKYERVQPWHSWNSDYPVGRILLFELTRHSDHHYKASKKYQLLTHLEKSPQLPTGYPGMMLLSLVPPIWFRIVNPRISRITP